MSNYQKKVVYVLGTKAQFIKCKHILLNLIKNNVKIYIVDTGQHRQLTQKELKNSGLVFEYINLTNSQNNISSVFQMIIWFIKLIFFRLKIENPTSFSLCLIHGDTVSTLIGLILSKKNKIKTVHIEAGYNSYNIFKPFPEEIIRNIVSKFSDILVVDGETQLKNVEKYKNSKTIIQISRNTIYDAVTNINFKANKNFKNVLSVTVHRTENLYDFKKLNLLIEMLVQISKNNSFDSIRWFCHDVTYKLLIKKKLIKKLQDEKIIIKKLVQHEEFISELINSKLVITDGGSIAEECSILGINTVIWRDVVENLNYLSSNVILSEYNLDLVYSFIKNIPDEKFNNNITLSSSPSKQLASQLINYL